ncbi:hypothetical protein [Saccharopolyspora shandongensis]|uniref:hypothetical protein n=1 Tax=Saccharopolyspora shandongensis TaxID=418495 RepID=UPI0033CA2230
MTDAASGFPPQFDQQFRSLISGSQEGYFGLDVLRGLVEGMNNYRRDHESSDRGRSLGPAMLGGFLWLDDDELIEAIAGFPAACVVVSKQQASTGRRERKQRTFDKLRRVCDSGNGFPAQACPELSDLAQRDDGRPLVVGPYTHLPDITVPTFRSIGPRKTGQHLVPILHTKMVLLGNLWWHDEGSAGYPEDVIGFTPEKLWLASANGTRSSRSNLEFGVWLTDKTLLEMARGFLTEVICHSEDIDPANDLFEPELAPYEFDDDTMAEAAELWGTEVEPDTDDRLP